MEVSVPYTGPISEFIDPISMEFPSEACFVIECGHLFDKVQLISWYQKQKSCPICRTKMVSQSLKSVTVITRAVGSYKAAVAIQSLLLKSSLISADQELWRKLYCLLIQEECSRKEIDLLSTEYSGFLGKRSDVKIKSIFFKLSEHINMRTALSIKTIIAHLKFVMTQSELSDKLLTDENKNKLDRLLDEIYLTELAKERIKM